MSITAARVGVEAPAVEVCSSGFLAGASVIDVPMGDHRLLGAEYITHACAEGKEWQDFCYVVANMGACDGDGTDAPDPPVGGLKQFGDPTLVEGSPFGVYEGFDCRMGSDEADQSAAEDRLSYAEARRVDYAVRTVLANEAIAATFSPGSLFDVFGALEDQLAASYGGCGYIVMSRSMASCAYANQLIDRNLDGTLTSVNGTRIINAAYSGPFDPSAGQLIYAVGQVTLYRGPVSSIVVPEVQQPNGVCNPRHALAERIYVPLIECPVIEATAYCDPTDVP